jgi:hypothetical protein
MSATTPILTYVFNPEVAIPPTILTPAGWDDFNSYSTGSITDLNGGSDEGLFAIGSGYFVATQVVATPRATWDDFDSYSTGAITVLNGGAGLNGTLLGTGRFIGRVMDHDGDSFDSYADGAITALGPGDSQAGDTVLDDGFFV